MDAPRYSVDRDLAYHNGSDYVASAETQSGTCRPNTTKNIHVSAHNIYGYAGELSSRVGDLLGLEQHFLYSSTMGDHASNGCKDRRLIQEIKQCLI